MINVIVIFLFIHLLSSEADVMFAIELIRLMCESNTVITRLHLIFFISWAQYVKYKISRLSYANNSILDKITVNMNFVFKCGHHLQTMNDHFFVFKQ